MRYIKRLPKPDILERKEKIWLEKFLASGNKRPNNKQYGHAEIIETLSVMSYSKCFYCESKLIENKQVDHYQEVNEDKTLAFNWENLFLTCKCNQKKLSNQKIPNEATLNPCIDSDEEIAKHLTFHGEQIVGKTEKGDLTIQKYKLNREELDSPRKTSIIKFFKQLIELQKNAMQEKRTKLSDKEINILRQFASKEKPFSLMFKILLTEKGFL